MPNAPARRTPPNHKPYVSRHVARERGEDHYELLNCKQWRKLREAFLAENPLCEVCGCGGGERDLQVHHKVSRRERPDLAFEWDNLGTLCEVCHGKLEGWLAAMKGK